VTVSPNIKRPINEELVASVVKEIDRIMVDEPMGEPVSKSRPPKRMDSQGNHIRVEVRLTEGLSRHERYHIEAMYKIAGWDKSNVSERSDDQGPYLVVHLGEYQPHKPIAFSDDYGHHADEVGEEEDES
jgi:hypothetical protein